MRGARPTSNKAAVKLAWIPVRPGAALAKQERHLNPETNFDAFDCIQHQEAETFVKNVQVDDIGKHGLLFEVV